MSSAIQASAKRRASSCSVGELGSGARPRSDAGNRRSVVTRARLRTLLTESSLVSSVSATSAAWKPRTSRTSRTARWRGGRCCRAATNASSTVPRVMNARRARHGLGLGRSNRKAYRRQQLPTIRAGQAGTSGARLLPALTAEWETKKYRDAAAARARVIPENAYSREDFAPRRRIATGDLATYDVGLTAVIALATAVLPRMVLPNVNELAAVRRNAEAPDEL